MVRAVDLADAFLPILNEVQLTSPRESVDTAVMAQNSVCFSWPYFGAELLVIGGLNNSLTLRLSSTDSHATFPGAGALQRIIGFGTHQEATKRPANMPA
jgi:hypothetical protein